MVAALKLREITEVGVGQELALRYQLVSRWTNYLAVVVRDDGKAAETLPDLHKVEQMLAAGWGGMGSVRDSRSRVIMDSSMPNGAYDMPTFSRMLSAPHKNKLKESKAIYS